MKIVIVNTNSPTISSALCNVREAVIMYDKQIAYAYRHIPGHKHTLWLIVFRLISAMNEFCWANAQITKQQNGERK